MQASAANSGADTNTVPLSSLTGAGDTLVVQVDWNGGGAFSSITDSEGDTFIQIGTEQKLPGGNENSRLYYAANIKGGKDSVTTIVGGAAKYHELYISEYAGLNPTAPLDAYSVNTGISSSFTSNNLTTTANGDLLYGAEVDTGNATAGSGWIARSTVDGNIVADKMTSAPGSYAFTGSSDYAFIAWIAAFKVAAPATAMGNGSNPQLADVSQSIELSSLSQILSQLVQLLGQLK